MTAGGEGTPVACQACPWRLENQGKPHPDGWYRPANLRRLWQGMRRGADMSCHPTDPTNPVSVDAQAVGYRPAPGHSKVRECVGAHVVKQREFMRWHDDYGGNISAYRKAHPNGLMRTGLLALAERYVFGGVPMIGGRPLPKPNLNDPDIGYDKLPAWEPRKEVGKVTG